MIVERYRFSLRCLIRVDDGGPCVELQVDGYRCHCCQEEVVFSHDLCMGLRAEQIGSTFGDEDSVMVVIVGD